MCGIAGVYTRSRDLSECASFFERMQQVICHRGPDDSGIDILPEVGVGLVDTRLSVIDLTPGGRQPMWNAERTIGTVFNGEIYNFRELRREIEATGVVFGSRSDTEVILKGYELWGTRVIERLNGMFAIALWDGTLRRLLLVRDRLGKKPLYYRHDADSNTLIFASEIKAILEWPGIRRRVSAEALHSYLALGYVPAPYTMFQGIKKLAPAHWLEYDGETLEVQRYWEIPVLGTWKTSLPEYRHAVRAEVEKSVARRLISDVPLGAFLSGGVDSTIVVGVMSRLLDEPVRTFSAAFDVGPRSFKYNVDADMADIVSKEFGTRHTRLTVKPGAGLLEHLKQAVWNMDEPHANPTMVTTYLLARLVKQQGVTVILTGDGGDELFGGYSRYLRDRYVSWLARVPPLLRHALSGLLRNVGTARRLNRALRKADLPSGSSQWYLNWYEQFVPGEREAILLPPWCEAMDAPNQCINPVLDRADSSNRQELLSYGDLGLWIAEESNMRQDKMTMAHALEARSPLLDYTLAELAMSIPFHHKVGLREGKRLLKDAFSDLLPDGVRNRPKHGWFSPRYYWVKDLLWEDAKELISWLPETGIFSPKVTSVLANYPPSDPQQIWSLMVFALWYRRYIIGE